MLSSAILESMSAAELLDLNISRLGFQLEGSPVEKFVHQLRGELRVKGINYHPPCHVFDEWFCPVDVPAIFVPFF
jgi:hypothetical protein